MRFTVLGAAALASLAAAAPAAEPPKAELLAAVEKQLKAAHEKAGPCVACVVVSRSDRYPKAAADPQRPGRLGDFKPREFLKAHPAEELLARQLDLSDPRSIADNGYACGVVIDPAGVVLTPYHVLEGATKVYVHLQGGTGSYADVHAADARHDLATLKLITPPEKLQAVKFADVRLRAAAGEKPTVYPGKLAVLVAHSYAGGFAVDKPSVALGSVTNVLQHRLLTPEEEKEVGQKKSDSYYNFGPLLEHDAKVNLGIDGAALLNLDGEVIGLATSTAAVTGDRSPHYAFPADGNFRRIVEVLRRGEEVEYGLLGITLSPQQSPVTVGMVTQHSAAELARLRAGDEITHVNGTPIRRYEELLSNIGSALAGTEVTLTVRRGNGRERPWDVAVTLGKFDNKQPFIASVRPEPVFGLRVDFGIPTVGVYVRELAENSPAAAAFKKLGDPGDEWVVTRVDGKPVATPAAFYAAAKGKKSVTLTVKDRANINGRGHEVNLP